MRQAFWESVCWAIKKDKALNRNSTTVLSRSNMKYVWINDNTFEAIGGGLTDLLNGYNHNLLLRRYHERLLELGYRLKTDDGEIFKIVKTKF